MGGYFRGWRRKLGFLNLLLVLLFIGAWGRSYVIIDSFTFGAESGTIGINWEKSRVVDRNAMVFSMAVPVNRSVVTTVPVPVESADPTANGAIESTSAVTPATYQLVTEVATPPARVGLDFDFNVPVTGAVVSASSVVDFHLEGAGFYVQVDDSLDGNGSASIMVPFWFLIIPLALLAAVPFIKRPFHS